MDKKKILPTILLLLVMPYFWLEILVWGLALNYKSIGFYDDCHKYWAHRGHHVDIMENTLLSFVTALNRGAKGIELDSFFNPNTQKFIISHDRPATEEYHLKLPLEEALDTIGRQGFIWIDFKNLGEFDSHTALISAEQLHTLLVTRNLLNSVIVESKHADNLALFAEKNIKTSYWIEPPNYSFIHTRVFMLIKRLQFYINNFHVFSIPYAKYSASVRSSSGGLPIHLFTVNDINVGKRFENDSQVKVILTDIVDYRRNSCSNIAAY